MAKLNANTVVMKDGAGFSLYKGDVVPEWAVDQVGSHLLIEEDPEPEAPEAPKEPEAPDVTKARQATK